MNEHYADESCPDLAAEQAALTVSGASLCNETPRLRHANHSKP